MATETQRDTPRPSLLTPDPRVDELVAAERRARDRSERLGRITASLVQAVTAEDVAGVVLGVVRDALGAEVGSLSLVSADGAAIETLAYVGDLDAAAMASYRRLPIGCRVPAADAVRSCEAVFIESTEDFSARYPEQALVTPYRGGTRCAIPLVAHDCVLGTINFGFHHWRVFTDDERSFMGIAADQCAIALERSRLFDAERLARSEAEAGRSEAEAEHRRAASLHQTLQRALKARDDLLAVVSHDLRNPLGVVSLNAAAIARSLSDSADEKLRRRVESIRSAARRMEQLINDLLDLGGIEAGQLRVEPAPHDLGALLVGAVDEAQATATARGVRVELDAVTPPLRVRCDPKRVMQVLSNLVGNAVKFTPAGGSITVRAEPDGATARVVVSDTGIGIGPDELSRVFERYYQAPTGERSGVGIGLFIVRGIVEAHGGRVWAESAPGEGSRFYFTLPLAEG